MKKMHISKTLLSLALCLTIMLSLVVPVFAVPTENAVSDDGLALAREIAAEGIVLLKNDDSGLPLKDGESFNIFGTTQVNAFYGGGGSGSTDASNAVSFLAALDMEGLNYNKELTATYTDWYNTIGQNEDPRPNVGENVIDPEEEELFAGRSLARAEMEVTNEIINSAKAFSDTAVIIIGRSGNEGADLGPNDVALYRKEAAMVDKVAKNFSKVIVLFNTCNVLEMGFLDEYDSIKSAAQIWAPGEQGMVSVAQMLNGKVNPSGKLPDTIAYSIYDHPSTVNFGDFVIPEEYQNQKIHANQDAGFDGRYSGHTFVNYAEDIYVGYRYFETEEFGAKEKVQYEFGFGLSYTTFDVSIDSFEANSNTVTVQATVTSSSKSPPTKLIKNSCKPID